MWHVVPSNLEVTIDYQYDYHNHIARVSGEMQQSFFTLSGITMAEIAADVSPLEIQFIISIIGSCNVVVFAIEITFYQNPLPILRYR